MAFEAQTVGPRASSGAGLPPCQGMLALWETLVKWEQAGLPGAKSLGDQQPGCALQRMTAAVSCDRPPETGCVGLNPVKRTLGSHGEE